MSHYARMRIRVKGSVQGVGYRYFAVRAAQQYDLGGWVKNLDDGDVEVVAEGQAGPLREFVETLRRGPAASRVTDLNVSPEPYTAEFTEFDVRY
jgi:acylphosphatase